MKIVTIKDIAEKAGVTKATVSMVINHDPRISAATRERVQAVVKAMNYYPNPSARRLAKGKSESIAFIAPRFAAPFISTVIDGLENRAYGMAKYLKGLQTYATHNKTSQKEELLRELLYGRKAEAVVMLSLRPSTEMVNEYHKQGVPLVLIENEMAKTHSIRVDNVQGAYKATKHLIRRGAKRIALFIGATRPKAGEDVSYPSLERLKGHEMALREHGLKRGITVEIRTYAADEASDAFQRLWKKGPRPDAIFCAAGDLAAMGVMEEARHLGVRIPEDLALIGYDDAYPSSLLQPSLTTVHQEFEEMGAMAFDIAVQAIEGKLKKEKKILIDPELVLRQSA